MPRICALLVSSPGVGVGFGLGSGPGLGSGLGSPESSFPETLTFIFPPLDHFSPLNSIVQTTSDSVSFLGIVQVYRK